MDISIQIVNYNTKKYLIDCLDSIKLDLKNSKLTYEVLVIDNASHDNLDDLTSMYGPTFSFVKNSENVGFGAAHNILAKQAKGDFIFLLNPDTKCIEPNTVERLLTSLKTNKVDILGPRLKTEHGLPQEWDHGDLSTQPFQLYKDFFCHNTYSQKNETCLVSWVSGAAFLIDRKLFERLNGFDPNFFLYHEEVDLCERARSVGVKVLYDPTIQILHHGGVVAVKNDHL